MIALGIIAIVLGTIGLFVFWWLGIIGLVLGIVAIGKGASLKANGVWITGLIGTIVCSVDVILAIVWFATGVW